MKLRQLLTIAGVSAALAATSSAQFSVSGGGSAIPTTGTGDDVSFAGDGAALYPGTQPGFQGNGTVVAPAAVVSVDSITIDGLSHTWLGDLQITLEDPAGVEHLIMLRPGFQNTSNFGASGNFAGGSYTFVESGGSALPTSSGFTADLPAGTYDQSFTSGVTAWVSGTNGINNTPMSTIAGPAGVWTLNIYDWAAGDTGNFSGWTLNANGGGGGNTGSAYCFGDGSGTACPCAAFGGTGEGCLTTSGTGATLTGSGDANTGNDTLVLSITGGPANKPGIFFQGAVQVNGGNGNFNGDGILCTFPQMRYDINGLDANGETTQTGFGANASAAQTLNYQYWFRDPQNTCGGLFNFSNGWNVTWN